MMNTLGIDLGGTNVRVALVCEEGNIMKETHASTEAQKGPDYVINKMKQMIREVTHSPVPIGIGSPGPLDAKNGVILSPPNLPGWDNIPLAQILTDTFHVPVRVDNDANAASLAEAIYGAGKGYESVYYITVSTGVGGGYVLDGKLIQGATGYAGEIGNMIIVPNGPTHPMLNAGALEVLASGTAIAKQGRERLQTKGDAGDVFALMKEGNEIAASIVRNAMNYLSIGIANIMHTLNPDVIVLGGGVMKSKDIVIPLLEAGVKSYVYPQMRESVNLTLAELGGNAGVIGAALLART